MLVTQIDRRLAIANEGTDSTVKSLLSSDSLHTVDPGEV
jgi:hypothetical protein